jgi:mycofactocin system transcriptional regulator
MPSRTTEKTSPGSAALNGRPPSTSHDEVAALALALFAEHGFEATTVADIGAAVGVGRRTIFRYFESKNDIVWGDFDWVMDRLREALDGCGPEVATMEALRRGVVASNRYEPDQLPGLRIRMTLITTVPALQAHSALRYADWRRLVAVFAAVRLGEAPDDLLPRAISHAALGTAMAAFGRWVQSPEEDLEALLDRAFGALAMGFGTLPEPT